MEIDSQTILPIPIYLRSPSAVFPIVCISEDYILATSI